MVEIVTEAAFLVKAERFVVCQRRLFEQRFDVGSSRGA